jgi:Bardet-Biedl syndrome 1 protein
MRFGPFGREAGSLLVTFASGAVSCKILSRNSTLAPPTGANKPPPEQDIPLKVPKKTKLYMEQSQRERENSIGN